MNTKTTSPAVLTQEARPRAAVLTKEQILSNRQVIRDVMANVMIKGIHYGVIPGTDKPTLYKPGSELLLSTFRIALSIDVQDESSDDGDIVRYRARVKGIHGPSGVELGEGIGECSSDEEKYKWRRPVCDAEWNEAAQDRRREVWKRGKSEPYKAKQVRTHADDIANTILKMAKKRAQIDFTLTALAVSDLFSQDLEDLSAELRESVVDGEEGEATEGATPKGKGGTTAPKAKEKAAAPANGRSKPADLKPTDKITPEQLVGLREELDTAGVPEKTLYQRYKVNDFAELTQANLDDLAAWLDKLNNPQ